VSNEDIADKRRVDAMVRGIDPLDGGSLENHSLDRALDDIGAAIVSRGGSVLRAGRRRRRWLAMPRGLAAVGLAVLAVGGIAAGAVVFVNARTGTYPTKPWEIRAGGPGEYLNLAGTNFRQVALAASSDIPYPPGYTVWRTWLLTLDAAQPGCPKGSRPGCKVLLSTGALRGSIAQNAFCAWVYDWRNSTQRGEATTAEQAARVISRAPSWKAVVALDPHPHASPPYGQPHGPMSDFGWLLPFRRAVLRDDISAVDQMLASNYGTSGCAFQRPPAASKNGTVIPGRARTS
jgi:hypothetical protein